ncbi:hypothetical protein [Paenibacillus abyssi]|uniref:Uncharacterized protein n=1 Tax=Paenibacillus abyssi TaxID=1340531 RepID=A0A917D4K6_9BACL|nr:hypothetical protein [Paenibacillus abyssi]GGG12206.1 hypothetical protein GCM10010916_31350 [Paenibacillus abyssi]
MLGSIRWNIFFGLFGFFLIFFFSISSNGIAVTLLKSVYAFVSFFAIAYALRLVLYLIAPPNHSQQPGVEEENKGAALDIVTPDDNDDLNRMLKEQMDGGSQQEMPKEAFEPLTPPKLVSTQDKSPEQLAQAVRHLSEQ